MEIKFPALSQTGKVAGKYYDDRRDLRLIQPPGTGNDFPEPQ
jgi:hypothetical protein